MNFIKKALAYATYQDESQLYQTILDAQIIGKFYKYEQKEFYLLSSNTEIVFDKLKTDKFDHIMIVRYRRASKKYNNKPYFREGDFYFNMSFLIRVLESEINQHTHEFHFDLVDSTHKEWTVKIHLSKLGYLNQEKCDEFKQILMKLMWVQHNKKPINELKNPNDCLKFIQLSHFKKLKVQAPKPQLKHANKKKVNRSALNEYIIRSKEEKYEISNQMLKLQEVPSILNIFSGSLFSLRPDGVDINLINNSIIFALCDGYFQIYDSGLRQLLFQSFDDIQNFQVDSDQNHLTWFFNGGVEGCSVLFVKFDQLDGAVTISILVQRQKMQKSGSYKEFQDSKWTDNFLNQSKQPLKQSLQQRKPVEFDDQIRQIIQLGDGDKFFIKQNQKGFSLFSDKKIYKVTEDMSQSTVSTQLDYPVGNLVSNDTDYLLTYSKDTREGLLVYDKQQTKIVTNEPIRKAVGINQEFLILCPKSINILTTKGNVNQVYQLLAPNDELTAIEVVDKDNLIVGTKDGALLLFNNIQNPFLQNFFPPMGNTITDIKVLGNELALINFGAFLHLQPLSTHIEKGFQIMFTIKPLPVKLQITPEDLLLLGIFDEPKFQNIGINEDVIIASIENAQFIWSTPIVLNQENPPYQVKILDNPIQDSMLFESSILTLDVGLCVRDIKQ